MVAQNTSTAFDKLYRALHAIDPVATPDGGHYLNVQGTMNIIGAGSGGTSQIDNSSFIPGGSSLTPIGGYVGGRSVASGNTAAPAMNASGMLIVAVGAGGAGGGVAQLQVTGTDGNWNNVGFQSGADFRNVVPVSGSVNAQITGSINPHGVFAPAGSVNVLGSVGVTPLASFTVNLGNIPTVNLGLGTVNLGGQPISVIGSVNVTGAGGGFASAAVYGSPANPVYVIGSVNVVNSAGGFASAAVYGSPANPVYVSGVGGSLGVTQLGAPWQITGSVWLGGIGADLANSAMRVNVVAGAAGGGVANLTVQGSNNTALHVGYASGAGINVDGGAYVPILGTVNLGAGAAPFASVAVYGSPANPVYAVGSVQVVNGSLPVFVMGGSMGVTQMSAPWSVVGSQGVSQLGAPWTVTGSVGVTPLASFTVNFGSIPTVNMGLGTVNVGNIPAVVGSMWTSNPFAQLQVVGTDNATWVNVGYASGNVPTANTVPVNVIAVQAAVHIISNPGSAQIVGSVNVTPGASFTVNMGSVPTVNLGLGTVNIGNIAAHVGSVNVTPVAAFSLAGVTAVNSALDVDPRANLTGTQWPISHAGSGYLGIAGASLSTSPRIKISVVHITADNSAVVNFQSPSGTYLTGSIRIPGAAGFNVGVPIPGHLWIGAANASLMMQAAGSGNIGGWISGWVE